MRIAIASDHAGFDLKEYVKKQLFEYGHEVVDFGTNTGETCDYPDHGRPAAESVSKGLCERGVLVCGTGIGMSIVANKVAGVYAALCSSGVQAEFSRRHNNANVLTMGGWLTGRLEADDILERFLKAEFEGGRHARRVGKVENHVDKVMAG